ncbi:MAG: IPT/TIG domain-containing protein [Methylococcales bacterium]
MAKADVGIAVSSAPDPVIAGAQLTYTITVTNNGPDPVSQVKITDNLPSTVNFVSTSSGCTQSALAVTCDVASLASGVQAVFNITVIPTEVGALSNTASAVGAETDPQANNNSATNAATVVAAATAEKTDLEITQTVNTAAVKVDGDLLYTLKVRNYGPDNASAVQINANFPVSANIAAAAGCAINGTTLTCVSGDLAAGASESFDVEVSPSAEGDFTSTATVTGAQTDPNQANNSASQSVAVSNSTVPALVEAHIGTGSRVTITGEGFGGRKGVVKIGNKSATVVAWTDGIITVKLPVAKAGVYPVKVISKTRAVFNIGQLTLHAPEISALSVANAAKNTKVQFTIYGRYFGNGVKPVVSLLSSKNKRFAATVLRGYNDGAMTVLTPKLKADSYRVLVSNGAGKSQLLGFTVN